MKNSLEIVPFEPYLAGYFERINKQWIEQMFVLEDIDKQVLEHPQESIIRPGGHIWFIRDVTLGIIGTCALLKKDPGVFELTKMGVLESARGLKAGEKLLTFVIQQARNMDTQRLFLLTNSACEAAIHLYEKNGFRHDAEIMARYGTAYERCDVAMRYYE